MELILFLVFFTFYSSVVVWTLFATAVFGFKYFWLQAHKNLPKRFWLRIVMLFCLISFLNLYRRITNEGGEVGLVVIVVVIPFFIGFVLLAIFEFAYWVNRFVERLRRK